MVEFKQCAYIKICAALKETAGFVHNDLANVARFKESNQTKKINNALDAYSLEQDQFLFTLLRRGHTIDHQYYRKLFRPST